MKISVLIVVITRLVGVTKRGAGDEFVNDWNVAGDEINWDAKFYSLSDNDKTYAGLLLIHGHENLMWANKKSFLIEDLREPIKLSLRYVEDKQKIKVRLTEPEIWLFVHGLSKRKREYSLNDIDDKHDAMLPKNCFKYITSYSSSDSGANLSASLAFLRKLRQSIIKSEIDKDLAQSIEMAIESNCINPSRFMVQSLITIRELLLRLKLDAETAAMATDSQLREEAVEGLASTYNTMYDMVNRPLILKLQPKGQIVDMLRLYVVAGNRNARRTERAFLEFNKNFTPPFKSEDFWKALGKNMLRKFDFKYLNIKEFGIDLTYLSKGVEDLISEAQTYQEEKMISKDGVRR